MKSFILNFRAFFNERKVLKRNEEIFLPVWWKTVSVVIMIAMPLVAFLFSIGIGLHNESFCDWITDIDYWKSWIGVFVISWLLAFTMFYVMDAGHIIIKDGVLTKRYRFVYTEKIMLCEITRVSMGYALIKNEGNLHLDIRGKSNQIIYINASAYPQKTLKLICKKIGF